MSLPALSEVGQKRVAAARLEADAILARSQTVAKDLVSQAHQLGVDRSGVGFSPGDTMLDVAREEINGGRSRAAAHLFGAVLTELLYQGVSDMATFSADLDKVSGEVMGAYSVDQETLQEFKRQAHATVLRQHAAESNGARRQSAVESSSSVSSWVDQLPKDSLAHRVAEDMQLLVKERTSIFASEHIRKLPKDGAPASEFLDFQATAISGAYEVWLSVFFDGAALTDDAAKTFEELCDEFAKTFMDQAASHALAFISKQALLTEVRTRMLQKKHHFLGMLLKKIRVRKEIIRRATTIDPLLERQSSSVPQTLSRSQANPPTEQVAPEPKSPSMAGTSSDQSVGNDERATLVDSFLDRCNHELNLPEKITKTHIWKFVGHSQPRQFQYWQAGEKRVTGATRGFTDEDEKNFRRVLTMAPEVFIEQLAKRGLLSLNR